MYPVRVRVLYPVSRSPYSALHILYWLIIPLFFFYTYFNMFIIIIIIIIRFLLALDAQCNTL